VRFLTSILQINLLEGLKLAFSFLVAHVKLIVAWKMKASLAVICALAATAAARPLANDVEQVHIAQADMSGAFVKYLLERERERRRLRKQKHTLTMLRGLGQP
jgi:hypothetical protein